MRLKTKFRQRNLYCQFELKNLPAGELEFLEAKGGLSDNEDLARESVVARLMSQCKQCGTVAISQPARLSAT